MTDTTATETSTTTEAPAGGNNEAGATEAPAAVESSSEADAGTILGAATTDTGTGDAKAEDSKAPISPTPVPDDNGVPEAYELKPITMGEGDDATTIEIDSALLETVTPGLKEAGIKQDQLDKLAPLVPAIQQAALKQMNDEFSATRADWAKQAQADPEIGGKNWAETLRLAAKGLDQFTGPAENNEFRKLLDDSGLGNHPAMIRAFRNIGASISEDSTFVRNTTVVEQRKSREEINYPNEVPKN